MFELVHIESGVVVEVSDSSLELAEIRDRFGEDIRPEEFEIREVV